MTVNLNTGTVRLVDRRTRVVEVLGPEPPGSRRPTDRELLFDTYQSMMDRPQRIGLCFQADGRRAKFLVDEGSQGDQLLDLLARRPKTPARPVRPYGTKGVAAGGLRPYWTESQEHGSERPVLAVDQQRGEGAALSTWAR